MLFICNELIHLLVTQNKIMNLRGDRYHTSSYLKANKSHLKRRQLHDVIITHLLKLRYYVMKMCVNTAESLAIKFSCVKAFEMSKHLYKNIMLILHVSNSNAR
jgi:hypothetical protein